LPFSFFFLLCSLLLLSFFFLLCRFGGPPVLLFLFLPEPLLLAQLRVPLLLLHLLNFGDVPRLDHLPHGDSTTNGQQKDNRCGADQHRRDASLGRWGWWRRMRGRLLDTLGVCNHLLDRFDQPVAQRLALDPLLVGEEVFDPLGGF